MFWLIWNPDHSTPPQQRYPTRQAANRAAECMARLYPGQTFYVLKAQSSANRKRWPRTEVYAPWGVHCPDPSAHMQAHP